MAPNLKGQVTRALIITIIIIIIRSRRQQGSVASIQSGHEPTTTSLGPFGTNAEECAIADLLDPAGVLAVAANQDQSGGRFLLLRPVIMRGGPACGHRVSPP